MASCVSTGTYKALQAEKQKSDSLYSWAMQTLKTSQGDNDRLVQQKADLKDSVSDMSMQLSAVNENNRTLHKEIEDLSAISSLQAESIRKSIDNIGAKDQYLQRLGTALSRRDSMNLAVLMELKAFAAAVTAHGTWLDVIDAGEKTATDFDKLGASATAALKKLEVDA